MLQDIYICQYNSPVGALMIGEINGKICYCDWTENSKRQQLMKKFISKLKARTVQKKTSLHERAIEQLDSYFNGELKEFNLPILLTGSDFQKETWTWLQKIPFGGTWTYEDLSKRVNGDSKAVRAVAGANGLNTIAIIIPCHRVIGKDGSLTGYSGGKAIKEKLLQLEGSLFNGQYGLFENP